MQDVPSEKVITVLSATVSKPVPEKVRISPPSWLRPDPGVTLEIERGMLIYATAGSIGARPLASVTCTSHEPAAAP